MDNRPFTVRLFNTFVPAVTTFYKDLVPYWEALGWRVEVVVSRAEYRAGRSKAWMSPETQVRWTTSFGMDAQGRLSKLIIMLTYIVSAAFYSLFGAHADRNLFITHPPLFYLWGYILRLLRKEPYYVVLMDLYPEVAIQDGLFAEGSFMARFLSRVAHFGLKNADGVFVIGRCMHELVLEIGVEAERIHFIPNWGDQDAIQRVPTEQIQFREEQGWQEKFVVLYSGNIGTSHYFDDVLEVARRLQERSDLLFVFIGHGHRRKEIEAYKDLHQLDNIELLPFQPQDRLPVTLSAGDLHFVSLREGFAGLVVPSKIYGIMAAGRPTLYQGVSWGELALMIDEEACGCVAPLADPDQLQSLLLAYLRDADMLRRQGEKARRLIEGRYGTIHACESYTAVLARQLS